MSPTLDPRTLILMSGVLYLVVPMAVWLMLRMPRSMGPLLWCAGGLLGGVSFIFIGLRGQIPDQVSYLVGQTALASGGMLVAQSMRYDLGRPWPWSLMACGLLGYDALLEYVRQTAGAPALGVLIRVVNLTVIMTLVHTAWQLGRAESSRNAFTIAGAYAMQGTGVVLNLVTAWAGSTEIQTLDGGLLNKMAYFLTLVAGLVIYMAYLGLAIERTARRTLKLTQDTARTEQWQRQRPALVQADRSRLINLLTDSLGQAMLEPLQAAASKLNLSAQEVRQGLQDRDELLARLGQTVKDILQANAMIERLRALLRRTPPRSQTFELGHLLYDLKQLAQARAAGQGTTLIFPHTAPKVELQGDVTALTHGLLQLLENALAAVSACDKKEISLTVWTEGESLGMRISDSGPGFPDEVLQRFASQNELTTPSIQGIGLFVVQNIVKEHYGKFFLDNPPSGGASVTLLLPPLHG